MNRLDVLVFAGGVGEHAPEVRRATVAGLGFLGVEIASQVRTLLSP
jgi:acetate kinase